MDVSPGAADHLVECGSSKKVTASEYCRSKGSGCKATACHSDVRGCFLFSQPRIPRLSCRIELISVINPLPTGHSFLPRTHPISGSACNCFPSISFSNCYRERDDHLVTNGRGLEVDLRKRTEVHSFGPNERHLYPQHQHH